MPDTLFTFDALATLAGASLLTFLIVQYTKGLVDRFCLLPTDLYAVFIGTLVLVVAKLGQGANLWDWRLYVLCFANGFLVAVTAGKINDSALRPPKMKNRRIKENIDVETEKRI